MQRNSLLLSLALGLCASAWAQDADPKFGMEFEFAGRGNRIVRFEEMPWQNYERLMRVVVEHYGGDPSSIRRVDFTKPTTLPQYPDGQRPMFRAEWTDPRGGTWRIEPEYVASRGLDGYELVTPVLEDTRELERILEKLEASGLVREGLKSGVHITVDGAGLVGPRGDARGLANLILLHENLEPLLRRMFDPVRGGGHSNRFARSLAVDHPGLVEAIGALGEGERTVEKLAEVFSRYDVREAQIHGSTIGESSQSKMWKYRSLNLAKALPINPQHDASLRLVEFRMFDLGTPEAHRLQARFYRRLVRHAQELAARGEVVRFRPRAPMPVGEDPSLYNTPEDPREARRQALELVAELGLDPKEFAPLFERTIQGRSLPSQAEFRGLVEALGGQGSAAESGSFRYRFELSGRGWGVVSLLRPVDAAVAARWDALSTAEKRAYFLERTSADPGRAIREHFRPDVQRYPWLTGELAVSRDGSWRIRSEATSSLSALEAQLETARAQGGRSGQQVELIVEDRAPDWNKLEGKRAQVEAFFQRAARWAFVNRVETLRPGRTLEAAPGSPLPAQVSVGDLNDRGERLEIRLRGTPRGAAELATLAKLVTHQLRAHAWGDLPSAPSEARERSLLEHYERYLQEVEGERLTPERRRIVEGLQRGQLGNSAAAVGAPLEAWTLGDVHEDTSRRAVRFAHEEYLSSLHREVKRIEAGTYGYAPKLVAADALAMSLGLTPVEASAVRLAANVFSSSSSAPARATLLQQLAASQALNEADRTKLAQLSAVDLARLDAAGLAARLGISADQARTVIRLREAQSLEVALELVGVDETRRAELRLRAQGLDIGQQYVTAQEIARATGLPAGVARQIVSFRDFGSFERMSLQLAGFDLAERAQLETAQRVPLGPQSSLEEIMRLTGLERGNAQRLIDAREAHPLTSFEDLRRAGVLLASSNLSFPELNSLSAAELVSRGLTLAEATRIVLYRDAHDLSQREVIRRVLGVGTARGILTRLGVVDPLTHSVEEMVRRGLPQQLAEKVDAHRSSHLLGRAAMNDPYDPRLAAEALVEAGILTEAQAETLERTRPVDLERASAVELERLGLSRGQAERVLELRGSRELSVTALRAAGFDAATASRIAEALRALDPRGQTLAALAQRAGLSPAGVETLRRLQGLDWSKLDVSGLREAGLGAEQIERLQELASRLGPIDQTALQRSLRERVRSWFAESGLRDVLLRSLLPKRAAEASVTSPSPERPVREGSGGRRKVPRAEASAEANAEAPPAERSAIDLLAQWRQPNGRVDWKRFSREKVKVEAMGLAHFGLGLFLKELAVAVESGDRLYVEEFFDALLTTDFYVEYGLFVLGARVAEGTYARYLQRYVKPRFVNSVLKTNLVLATGLALPAIVHGRFEGRAFAISLGSLGLSTALVQGGTRGLKWVVDLRRARTVGGVARTGLALKRLSRAGAWFYSAAELAVILYVAEDFDQAANGFLDRLAAERAIGEAGATFLDAVRAPGATPESVTAAAEAYDEAWTTYRDFLYKPLFAAEAQVAQRMQVLAEDAKALDDERRESVARLAEHPGLRDRVVADHGSLENYAQSLVERDERELQTKLDRILASYDRERTEQLAHVYDGERRDGRYLTVSADFVRTATRTGALVWKRQLRSRVSSNRLQAYEDELEVFALAQALLDDAPELAQALGTYAERVEATRAADDQLAHGERGILDTRTLQRGLTDAVEGR